MAAQSARQAAPTVRLPNASYAGGPLEVEYQWLEPEQPPGKCQPLLVFLHEGLGSLGIWRGFPQQVCNALGCRGLVYSREAYGWSGAQQVASQWPAHFLDHQADVVLPALLSALGIDCRQQAVVLVGHSDGASIALIAAAHMPRIAGMAALAPHTFVEPQTTNAIAQAKQLYAPAPPQKGLRDALARHHQDADSLFACWSSVWLSEAFGQWDIRPMLSRIACPCVVVQGLDDPYGSNAHAESIRAAVPHTQLVYLQPCGHEPHKDCAVQVVQALADLIAPSAKPLG
ncbi:alpha/beta hydrolase [Comamonadaceae bacterium M7527]|nr:alpha/beta hydrolase [Comamonadaceae bacterium M7527]